MEVRLGVGDGERVSACLGWGNNVEMGWWCEWPEEVTSAQGKKLSSKRERERVQRGGEEDGERQKRREKVRRERDR